MARQIKLLGTLEFLEDGQTAVLMKSPKGSALLAYLIASQQTKTRETVANLLWEADSTSASLQSLRRLLSRIRPLVPSLHITRTHLAYQQLDDTVDLYALETGLQAQDAASLDAGLQQYQGDLLAGFHLANAPYFNEWLLLAREQLRQRVQRAYARLCRDYQTAEQWGVGIAAAQRWLALDDLNEAAWRALLQMLAGDGQKSVGG